MPTPPQTEILGALDWSGKEREALNAAPPDKVFEAAKVGGCAGGHLGRCRVSCALFQTLLPWLRAQERLLAICKENGDDDPELPDMTWRDLFDRAVVSASLRTRACAPATRCAGARLTRRLACPAQDNGYIELDG